MARGRLSAHFIPGDDLCENEKFAVQAAKNTSGRHMLILWDKETGQPKAMAPANWQRAVNASSLLQTAINKHAEMSVAIKAGEAIVAQVKTLHKAKLSRQAAEAALSADGKIKPAFLTRALDEVYGKQEPVVETVEEPAEAQEATE